MDDGGDDFIFVGTPIEREEDTSARKRKATADAGQLRTLPSWKQEVRDEEGRRRFHGAFTGGFSAGYFNTVGSKEGWTPQTFTSSRKNRAEAKQQSIYNFLDEEDLKGMGGHALETSMQFDTFGSTAAEYARKQAEKEQTKRPSAIPGPVHDDLIIPATSSIGVTLLLKMGWRHGHSIKGLHADSIHEARREARKAFLAFSGNDSAEATESDTIMPDSDEFVKRSKDALFASKSTPVYVLQPKQDFYGLGYDPYKYAPEFRDKKNLQESRDKKRGNYAPGFGIGALEELDFEDEDIYTTSIAFDQSEVEEAEQPKAVKDTQYRLEDRKEGGLRGFKMASNSDYVTERFRPPVIPANFTPHHKFPNILEETATIADLPPPDVLPPEDSSLKLMIDGFASLVARCGKLFEDLSKEKNKSNPLFSFLAGGNGHSYYERRLWEEKQKKTNMLSLPELSKSKSSSQKMTADDRGRVLGEKPLQKSSRETSLPAAVGEVIQANFSSNFIKPESNAGLLESAKPFRNDPAKQERFDQFLKDKYHGGLRSMFSSGTTIMSEADRARERLDFEAAAEAIEKGQLKMDAGPSSSQNFMDSLLAGSQQFVKPAEKHEAAITNDKVADKLYPKREEFQWRPLPILCKRFDITDPFMGKPPPLPRPKSKMDTLFFMTESIKNAAKLDDVNDFKRDELPAPQSEQEVNDKVNNEVHDIEQSTRSVQRPVDLYKAIFSDDSDEDENVTGTSQVADIEVKNEGANKALNRLVAGDFLESLGKELGLEIPSNPVQKPFKESSMTSGDNTRSRDAQMSLKETGVMAIEQPFPVVTRSDGAAETSQWENLGNDPNKCHNKLDKSATGVSSELKEDRVHTDNVENQERKSRKHSRRKSSKRSMSSDSSDDEHYKKSRRAHSRHRRRSRTPGDDYSVDYQDERSRVSSRSRRRSPDSDSSGKKSRKDKRSSKDSSKNHSRHHHRHKRRNSPVSYSSSEDDRVSERKSRGKKKYDYSE